MKRLVLLGGGHAHLAVLRAFAQRPVAGWDLHLVTPSRQQIYSGMVPGWIAGRHPLEACVIPLDKLASQASATFHETRCERLDLAARRVHGADGAPIAYDLLSIDTGPMPAFADLPGAQAHAIPLRPISAFASAWPALVDRMLGRCRTFEVVVLGAGAAGTEVAFALRRRAIVDGWSHVRVTLVGAGAQPLEGGPASARRRAADWLARGGVRWVGGHRAARVEPDRVVLDDGTCLPADATLLATAAAAPAWVRACGLATDERGFLRVGPTLQSASDPQVLAAGDVAALADARPKAGVFAVRAGPVLAHNLRALSEGRPPRRWRPQRQALSILAASEQLALASWGPFSVGGRWVDRWKSHLDRRFMARHAAGAEEGRR